MIFKLQFRKMTRYQYLNYPPCISYLYAYMTSRTETTRDINSGVVLYNDSKNSVSGHLPEKWRHFSGKCPDTELLRFW